MTILAEFTGLDLARNLVLVIIVLVCLLLSLAVLMQRPKQEGLGAAFGGDTMNDLVGAGTTDVLQKSTAWLGTALFVLTFVFALLVSAGKSTSIKNESEAPKGVIESAEDKNQQDAVNDLLDDTEEAEVATTGEETTEDTPAENEAEKQGPDSEASEVNEEAETTQESQSSEATENASGEETATE